MSKSEDLPQEGWFRFWIEDEPETGVVELFVGIHPSLEPAGYREVGVDASGLVVHRCPDDRFPMGEYGWFDPHHPPVSTATAVTRDEFDAAWARSDLLHVKRTWLERLGLRKTSTP